MELGTTMIVLWNVQQLNWDHSALGSRLADGPKAAFTIEEMIPLFFGFIGLMTIAVIGLSARFFGSRIAGVITAALFGWFLYVGWIGYFGLLQNITMRPPGATFLLLPVVALIVIFIWRICSPAGERAALAIPLWILVGTQCFREVVELFLHELWQAGLIPKMLTFAGANLDIYVGASAPLLAWLAARAKAGIRVALIWNVLGLLVLANVVLRAVFTTPGPLNLIRAEVPDLMIGTFPFMFIPGFFVPLAVVLHVLALRQISIAMRSKRPAH